MKLSIVQSQVQSHIEEKFKNLAVQKAVRGQLSVSKYKSRNAVSIRVTFSKDYLGTHISLKEPIFQNAYRACGWWTINTTLSPDFWLFVLFGPEERSTDYILVPRADLLKSLDVNHLARGHNNLVHSHLCVTNSGKCWEIRNLPKEQRREIAEGKYRGVERNFTEWLNNWTPLEQLNSEKS
ncbi:MAG TPA: hypothetical protein VJX69_08575 [Terriglobales bacterium]|nr:hypothetical protein [Terriglobales bacterium]